MLPISWNPEVLNTSRTGCIMLNKTHTITIYSSLGLLQPSLNVMYVVSNNLLLSYKKFQTHLYFIYDLVHTLSYLN